MSIDVRAMMVPEPVVVPRRAITAVLFGCIVALSIASFAGQISTYVFGYPFLMGAVPLFYVDLEGNLPTWYQATVFMFAALLVFCIHLLERRRQSRYAAHWLLLGCLLVALSIDEASQLHELTMEPLSRWIGRLEGAWRPMWVILGIAAVAVVGAFYLGFFLHLDRRERIHVVLAGALFVGGAVGVEMATAAMYEVYEPKLKLSLRYAVMAHIEELAEMLGLWVFVDFLLLRLSRLAPLTVMVTTRTRTGAMDFAPLETSRARHHGYRQTYAQAVSRDLQGRD